MLGYVAIIAGVLLALVSLYFASETVRNFVKAIWYRWFRDSEINLAADVLTAFGSVAEFADDPALHQLLINAGIDPMWLIVGGIVLRFIRGFRDREMIPLTKYPEN